MDGMNNRIEDLDQYVQDMSHSMEPMRYGPVARSMISSRLRVLDPIIAVCFTEHELVRDGIVSSLETHFKKQ